MYKIILLFLLPFFCFGQNRIVTGTVLNELGNPVSKCSVIVDNKENETTTDQTGSYTITIEKGKTITFSAIGYQEQTVVIDENNTLNATLKAEKVIEEVVVTSLGIRKEKLELSYASQELKGIELTRAKDPTLVNTLSGKIAGMIINRSSSGLGGSTKVVIRGNSSFRNNDPLYVIDGIPLLNTGVGQPNTTFGGVATVDGGDLVSQLNPEDFASVSVLKGSAATALYGILGSNGVVLLTTQKGNRKKWTGSFSSTTNFESITNLPKFQTEYKAPTASSLFSWTPNNDRENFRNQVPDFFKTGVAQTTALNFTNSNENSFTTFSLANVKASGVMPDNEITRYNVGVRHESSISEKLKFTASFNYANTQSLNRPNVGLYFNPLTGLYLMPRGNGNDLNYYEDNFEIFDPSRNLMTQNWAILNDAYQQNPYWITKRNQNQDKVSTLTTNFALNYKVNNWLSLDSRFGYTSSETNFEKKIYAGTSNVLSHPNGRYYTLDAKSNQKYADVMATIKTEIGSDFTFDALVGGSVMRRRIGDSKILDSGENGLLYANVFNIAAFATTAKQSQELQSENEIQSIYATSNLGYKKFLFAQITARNDWSSSLVNTNSLSSFYPSVGLTGIVSEMIKLPSFIDFLKLRTSFAYAGNDITPFVTSPRVSIVNGQITFPSVGIDPSKPLKPELKKEFEIGTEMRFLNNRFGLEFTYYSSRTSNQYVEIDAPTNINGYLNYGVNLGSISNKGIELNANAKIINNKRFNWISNVNFAKNKNIVQDLGDNTTGQVIITESGSNGYQYALIEGQPFGVIKGRSIERDEQGRVKLDSKGNMIISGFKNVGNTNPDFMLSLGNTLKFGNFNASILIDGRFGGQVMSMTESMNDLYGVSKASGDARNAGGVLVHGVNPDGTPVDKLFSAQSYYAAIAGRDGALGEYVYSATNVILRELSLGYTIKLKKIKSIDAVDVSIIGRNLFFIAKKAPFDPNISLSTGQGLQGIDIFGLPSTRTIGVNINVKF